MERETFVAALIAALQENEALANGVERVEETEGDAAMQPMGLFEPPRVQSSTDPTQAMARTAYEALQFDFPVVDDASLLALADIYRGIADGRVSDVALAADFALSTTMIEGVEYLNNVEPSAAKKRRGSEASGLLAAALLLCIPAFCLANPQSRVVAGLLRNLHPPVQVKTLQPLPPHAEQLMRDHAALEAAETDGEGDAWKTDGDFLEVFAAEEDPDDLSLVYEGDVPSQRLSMWPGPSSTSTQLLTASREQQLQFLASKTFSTTFSMISSEKWSSWGLNDVLFCVIRTLVTMSDENHESGVETPLCGPSGEWQRYLFVLRDHVLRLVTTSDVGIATLCKLVESFQPAKTTASDPFSFSFAKKTETSTDTASVRVVFRVLAELAVAKEFHGSTTRRAQHTLAVHLTQLYSVILAQLQSLTPDVSNADFATQHGDFLVVLLQLLHFVLDEATETSASGVVTRLHESGLLRVWLTFLPTEDDTLKTETPVWLTPLLRLLAECSLWLGELTEYLFRVLKFKALLPTIYDQLPAECALFWLATSQHRVAFPTIVTMPSGLVVWELVSSERVFPSSTASYLESMHKMSDALFLLEGLSKALASLQPALVNDLRTHLQKLYSTRFTTAFQYPGFAVPVDTEASVPHEEPEPPPTKESQLARRNDAEQEEEKEERGRAEALQFIALRNRLRQCAKTILLARTGSAAGSSSKLD
ncbi:hypothetical protein Poli38472_014637 [Pythium oligandrum]|uniref:Uncharacterized protein n=1 Tax=Pythium oligandrum TaxID=41045 RepID=A0A8K1FLK9_PYTOL|nr:hypothetical protein Poli38472_014637 [Pythium oligandrum]|eukprot:TMW63932.1 hypothetical protein Poli38472_014637 [Pythium oligandrum]